MQIVETFGQCIERWSDLHPERTRRTLCLGWEAQNLKNKCLPDKRLTRADQHLAVIMMNAMLEPLKKPESSAIVSIFTPCEL